MAYTMGYKVSGLSSMDKFKKEKEKFAKKYGPVHEDFIADELKRDFPKDKVNIELVGKCMMDHWMGVCSCRRTADCPLIRAWTAQKIATEKALSKQRMEKNPESSLSASLDNLKLSEDKL